MGSSIGHSRVMSVFCFLCRCRMLLFCPFRLLMQLLLTENCCGCCFHDGCSQCYSYVCSYWYSYCCCYCCSPCSRCTSTNLVQGGGKEEARFLCRRLFSWRVVPRAPFRVARSS